MSITLKPLRDQVIVITGASSGIGLVTARTAAKRGAKVLMVARSEDVLRDLVKELQADGCRVEAKAADVGDPAGVQAAADYAVEVFGRIDTWVNDAGSAIYGKVLDTPLDDQEKLFKTNYFGVVNGCMAAVPHLKGGGALITVGSLASDMPAPPMGVYSATKHAVKAYVEVLRMELAADDVPISVTLVKPAGIDTPIGQHAENHGSEGEAQIPPPAYDPQIVADAILDCAVHPRREITVGGVGRAQVLFSQHFPVLYEWIAPRGAKGAYSPNTPQPKPSNLKWGVGAGQERSGEHPHSRKTSLYTAAALRPKTTAAIGLGGLALAAGLIWARRDQTA